MWIRRRSGSPYPAGRNARLAMVVILGVGALATVVPSVQAQQGTARKADIVQLRPNVFMISGAGANVAVQFGSEGFVVVDTGGTGATDAVLAALTELQQRFKTQVQGADVLPKVRYVYNTSAHPDHIGGNERVSKSGSSIGGGGVAGNTGAATILAHDNVTQRMSDMEAVYPVASWPTEGYTGRMRSYYFNDDGIQAVYQPAAHSDGDSIVSFRRADVIVTGEIFDITRFPIIDIAKGGSIQGELDALNRLVDMAIPPAPLPWKEGRTLIIPARGRVCDQADLVEYRDTVTLVRDTIQSLIKKGMTLEQVKAANPTLPARGRYGSDSGPWTTDMFVEAVYKSLTTKSS